MSETLTNLQTDTIAELAKALAAAQGSMGNAVKDSANPFFKSSYSSLASVREACQEHLSKFGIAVIQSPTFIDGAQYLCTTLAHSSGQWMRGFYPINPVKNDPQGVGSAITYARRYALAAMTGVAPEDDDGNAASNKTGKSEGVKDETAPSFSREDKITQIDMIDEINHCMTPNDLKGFWEDCGEQIDKLPDAMAKTVSQQAESRGKQIDDGINPPLTYRFCDVLHAESWGKIVINAIKGYKTEKEIIDWHSRNAHKVDALDVMLKAAKYQINGTSPAQRLRKAMNDRVMELKQGVK